MYGNNIIVLHSISAYLSVSLSHFLNWLVLQVNGKKVSLYRSPIVIILVSSSSFFLYTHLEIWFMLQWDYAWVYVIRSCTGCFYPNHLPYVRLIICACVIERERNSHVVWTPASYSASDLFIHIQTLLYRPTPLFTISPPLSITLAVVGA